MEDAAPVRLARHAVGDGRQLVDQEYGPRRQHVGEVVDLVQPDPIAEQSAHGLAAENGDRPEHPGQQRIAQHEVALAFAHIRRKEVDAGVGGRAGVVFPGP